MPKVPILMPQLGDSIAEATVLRLLAAPGDSVEADQEIFEVETNKATMGVTHVRRHPQRHVHQGGGLRRGRRLHGDD